MKKGNITTSILIFVFLIGLSLLLYPFLSDCWNSFHQTEVINEYTRQVEELESDLYQQVWNRAQDYNESLLKKLDRYELTDDELTDYQSQLNISDNGVIGYIDIPSINCYLPIYHGTDKGILQKALGHLQGTSLPIGGKGTHSVISGHRGLPSAQLLTDLDRMKEGDIFVIHVLDQMLTYEVDQIIVVEPEDYSALEIEKDADYCTLMTCTPYGINTHRLLVRGHRVANQEVAEEQKTINHLLQKEFLFIIFGVIILILLGLLWKWKHRKE